MPQEIWGQKVSFANFFSLVKCVLLKLFVPSPPLLSYVVVVVVVVFAVPLLWFILCMSAA